MAFNRLKETRMMSKALVQQWDMGNAKRCEGVAQLFEVCEDQDASDRELQSACRGLVAAEKQAREDGLEPTFTQDQKNWLAAFADRLGVKHKIETTHEAVAG